MLRLLTISDRFCGTRSSPVLKQDPLIFFSLAWKLTLTWLVGESLRRWNFYISIVICWSLSVLWILITTHNCYNSCSNPHLIALQAMKCFQCLGFITTKFANFLELTNAKCGSVLVENCKILEMKAIFVNFVSIMSGNQN